MVRHRALVSRGARLPKTSEGEPHDGHADPPDRPALVPPRGLSPHPRHDERPAISPPPTTPGWQPPKTMKASAGRPVFRSPASRSNPTPSPAGAPREASSRAAPRAWSTSPKRAPGTTPDPPGTHSALGDAERIGHPRAAGPHRLVRALGGVLGRLVLHLGVDLRTQQHDDGRQPDPGHAKPITAPSEP